MDRRPIGVFDSGLGGLTVFSELIKLPLNARYVYVADNAGFPYGRLTEEEVQSRVCHVMDIMIKTHQIGRASCRERV